MSSRLPDQTSTRERWPDIAKGACILLVVLWHVVTKHYQRVDWDTTLPITGMWGSLGEALLPLRMPLFFTISGMFAVAAVRRPLGELARTRIAKFAYLYALWLLIHTAIMSMTPDFDTARATSAGGLLEQLTITPTNLWYLYALAAYFAVARLTRDLPRHGVLGAAFVLSTVAAAHLLPEPSNRGQVYQNLFFFLAGLHGRDHLERLARRATPGHLVVLGSAYVMSYLAMRGLGADTWPGVWPVVSIAATLAGVTAAALLGRGASRLATGLAALGRRTLPVYVMHLPLLACVDALLRGPATMLEPRGPLLAVVEPILLVPLLVATCLGLERCLRAARATWLLDLPRRRRVVTDYG